MSPSFFLCKSFARTYKLIDPSAEVQMWFLNVVCRQMLKQINMDEQYETHLSTLVLLKEKTWITRLHLFILQWRGFSTHLNANGMIIPENNPICSFAGLLIPQWGLKNVLKNIIKDPFFFIKFHVLKDLSQLTFKKYIIYYSTIYS